ncbi:glycosyltransferase family 4 protein [Catellatospora bangladeshensis]|uniref:Glycosyl transferase n=1 Tax=Catellatospora bangladeshensis TaxID=310355 RepID=A0A8J3JQE4_9ACTN|nr:glycosyltransferase family 4 protein [Catellatospora bangladeshensis]GIF81979.1 glycosyl transferase [Catellatospora bangladeshensis]
MYFMTIASLPLPIEAYKDERPAESGIWGAEVAKAGLLRAVLQHSRCEAMYLPCTTRRQLAVAGEQLTAYPNRERVRPVLLADYPDAARRDRMVLFHPGSSGEDGIRDPGLQGLVNLRAFVGDRRWPITGVTHSISGGPGFWYAFGALLMALRGHDALVCTSRAGRAAVERLASTASAPQMIRARLPVIPLGTDATKLRPGDKAQARARLGLAPGAVVILYLGRFSAYYKADLFPLILAFRRLPPKQRAIAALVLAGDDVPHRIAPKLEAFAGEVGVGDMVTVVPNPTSEVKRALYDAADVFVSPTDSVQETFGQTVIEAMACGLPVIASDWDGHRDTVQHGVTGFLAPTQWADCFEHLRHTPFLWEPLELYRQLGQAASVDLRSLTAYLEQLIDDPELRAHMGAEARRRVLQHYDWPVVVRRYEELWLELLNAEERADEASCDELGFDYLDTFRAHPTSLINVDAPVQVSAQGAELAKNGLRFLRVTELSEELEICAKILATCASDGKIPISELMARVADESPDPRQRCFPQIAQLVKYGILELAC